MAFNDSRLRDFPSTGNPERKFLSPNQAKAVDLTGGMLYNKLKS